jgi:hypothetical protein
MFDSGDACEGVNDAFESVSKEELGRLLPLVGKNAVSVKLDAFRDGGTVMPSAFAVLRLIMKVNLLTCSIGRWPACARHRVPA